MTKFLFKLQKILCSIFAWKATAHSLKFKEDKIIKDYRRHRSFYCDFDSVAQNWSNWKLLSPLQIWLR